MGTVGVLIGMFSGPSSMQIGFTQVEQTEDEKGLTTIDGPVSQLFTYIGPLQALYDALETLPTSPFAASTHAVPSEAVRMLEGVWERSGGDGGDEEVWTDETGTTVGLAERNEKEVGEVRRVVDGGRIEVSLSLFGGIGELLAWPGAGSGPRPAKSEWM
jgi:hypothetical protein